MNDIVTGKSPCPFCGGGSLLEELELRLAAAKALHAMDEAAMQSNGWHHYPAEKPDLTSGIFGDWIVMLSNGRTRQKKMYTKKSWEGVTHWMQVPPLA